MTENLLKLGSLDLPFVLAGFITIYTMDPNSKDSFFLHGQTSGNLIAGVVVAFFLIVLGNTAAGGVAAILSGYCSVIHRSYTPILRKVIGPNQSVWRETQFHARGFYIGPSQWPCPHFISLRTQPDEEKVHLLGSASKYLAPKSYRSF